MYMFRAISCSGGQIVLTCTPDGHLLTVTIPDTVLIQFDLLRMSKILLIFDYFSQYLSRKFKCHLNLTIISPTAIKPRGRSWLKHCATCRKFAGSIPDGVIGILHWHNPSGRTIALGSTQPLTETSTRNISWG